MNHISLKGKKSKKNFQSTYHPSKYIYLTAKSPLFSLLIYIHHHHFISFYHFHFITSSSSFSITAFIIIINCHHQFLFNFYHFIIVIFSSSLPLSYFHHHRLNFVFITHSSS